MFRSGFRFCTAAAPSRVVVASLARYAVRRTPTLHIPCVSPVFRRGYAISTTGDHVEQIIDQLSDNEYSQIANEYLETLSDELEMLAEDYPQVDAELSLGVMTLSVGEGKTYVINKQPPNKQIWLSSPISGPKRYDLIGGKWITLRDNTALTDLLEEELLEELGTKVVLELEN